MSTLVKRRLVNINIVQSPNVIDDFTPAIKKKVCKENNILKDINEIDIPEEVKIKAISIFREINHELRRRTKRKLLIYYVIHSAYRELQLIHNYRDTAKKLGLTEKEISRASTMFSEAKTGYRSVITPIDALDLIAVYGGELGLSSSGIDEARKLATTILRSNTRLLEEPQKKVAAGIFKYYFTVNGVIYDNEKFKEVMNLSDATINTIYKMICSIDNSS